MIAIVIYLAAALAVSALLGRRLAKMSTCHHCGQHRCQCHLEAHR